MAWKPGTMLGALVLGITSLPFCAAGQESVYSADSLMAAFDKGSKVSPKGTQITFRDVVVESEGERVTFKSSRNKRIICKLILSSEDRNRTPSVGSDVTVVGKVRGRGLLGNVTLDDCSLASPASGGRSASLERDAPVIPAEGAREEDLDSTFQPAPSPKLTKEIAPTQTP